MNTIIRVIEEAGLREHVKIMIGSAGTTQDFADEIGVDGYAQDAIAAVRQVNEFLAIATKTLLFIMGIDPKPQKIRIRL